MRQNSLQESLFEYGKNAQVSRPVPPFNEDQVHQLKNVGIYMGTTSWKYRGWEGAIYRGGYSSEAEFQKSALQEYASFLPSVGLEFTQFAWPNSDMMSHLHQHTPEQFQFCVKVTKKLTQSVFPKSAVYGKWAGMKNPDFMNLSMFESLFLKPLEVLRSKLGPLLFDFSDLTLDRFPALLEFFKNAPKGLIYAVELQCDFLENFGLLKKLLNLGVSPSFSVTTQLPSVKSQLEFYERAGGLEMNTAIVGLGLLRTGMVYDQALQYFQPIGRFKDSYPEGTSDLIAIVNFALQQKRSAYILVSNRLEGSAPHTIGNILGKIH